MVKRTLVVLLATIFLAGCAFDSAAPASESSSAPKANGQGIVQSENKPIPKQNLITGEPLKEGEAAGTRPAAVMVSNIAAAFPQRGIAAADAIFEMETEGGITRLLALYSNPPAMPQVGPVRSARDQHLQFVLPLNAVFTHIGSSVYAQNLLNQYQYQDIDGLYLGTTSFVFDKERSNAYAQEHCWYTDGTLVSAGMQQTGIVTDGSRNTLFEFSNSNAVLSGKEAEKITFLTSPTTEVQMNYDAASGMYLKTAYGQPHIDESTGTQLAFKNVLVLFDTVTMKPDGVCTNFALTSGEGYYFSGGKYQEIKWKKEDVTEPLIITDTQGKPFKINQGKSYIALIRKELKDSLHMGAEDAAQLQSQP